MIVCVRVRVCSGAASERPLQEQRGVVPRAERPPRALLLQEAPPHGPRLLHPGREAAVQPHRAHGGFPPPGNTAGGFIHPFKKLSVATQLPFIAVKDVERLELPTRVCASAGHLSFKGPRISHTRCECDQPLRAVFENLSLMTSQVGVSTNRKFVRCRFAVHSRGLESLHSHSVGLDLCVASLENRAHHSAYE